MSTPIQALQKDGSTTVKPRSRRTLVIGAVLLVILLLLAGVLPRISRSARAKDTAEAAATELPLVNVIRAKTAGVTSDLLLPGHTEAINVARLYARASGYILDRRADIGTVVKRGQVLAVIESPEVDQQLEQARANVVQAQAALAQAQANLEQAHAGVNQASANVLQAKANEDIAATTNDRWTRLVSRGVLPKQAGDERRSAFAARHAETEAADAAAITSNANVQAREADVKAAQAVIVAQIANVHRLERLQNFERVVAPFDGVVTERKVERGDLVSADAGGDRNLFSVAQARVLRIQVNVPQYFAVDLRAGQPAELIVRERPGKSYRGLVARTAHALDPGSRTLLTEIQVDNATGELLPGMYADVKFVLPVSHPTILVPGNALVVNSLGTRVVKIDSGNRAHYVPVQLGRDMGTEVEVLSGVSESDQIVSNPVDTLRDGESVRIIQPASSEKKENHG